MLKMLDVKSEKYKVFAEKIYEICLEVQSENERCALGINGIKSLVRRYNKDVHILKRRLDKHNDSWRSLPMVVPHPKRKIEQKRGPKPKMKTEESKEKKVRKQRVKKEAHDKATTDLEQKS